MSFEKKESMKNKFIYATLFSIVIPSLLVDCSSNENYLTANDDGTSTIKIYKSENPMTKIGILRIKMSQ